MRWINAEAKIRMQIYDEEHEEYITREMTVEDALDAYTEDGCPTTVEAEPIRHGHWKHTFGGYVNCSVCGATPLLDGEREYVETCYCPNCGAKMDEVNDD